MQLLKLTKELNIMAARHIAMVLSLVFIIIAVGSLIMRGLNFGIDFTGGTLIEVGYSRSADLQMVRQSLGEAGFDDAQVQHFGTAKDVLIRIALREGEDSASLSTSVLEALKKTDSAVSMRRVEFVGPQVGEELTERGGLAMLYALFGILIYVALRFEYRFAFGAIIAAAHDAIVTIGVFSLTQLEFDLSVLAAVLAVIGYSLNDTIVVFDRIRENFRKMRKKTPVEIMNTSINQTLARTVMTSLTTLLVLTSLFVFGGEIIHSFSIALIIGVIVGTYSSIYVASSVALFLGVSKQDLVKVKKGGVVEEQP